MNCFGTFGNNTCLWLLIILLILCFCGNGNLDGIFNSFYTPLIIAAAYCVIKKRSYLIFNCFSSMCCTATMVLASLISPRAIIFCTSCSG